jgi:hypothetical protein
MLRTGILVFMLVVTSTAWAATTDCIAQGGERLCTEPVLKSEKLYLCSETAANNRIWYLEQSCGWHPTSVYTSVSDIISKRLLNWGSQARRRSMRRIIPRWMKASEDSSLRS